MRGIAGSGVNGEVEVVGRRVRAEPVAIVDIGSNSVRLVAYEALSRALTPIFNEKVLCGLGRGVATTGILAPDAIEKALAALRCFRLLCDQMGITDITVLATAATREASNGPDFLRLAREAIGTAIDLIGGPREAELSALGVVSGFHRPDGIVGDLGGGSLELIDVADGTIGGGVSLPIGGLALSDLAGGSPTRAVRIVREALREAKVLERLAGRTFFAVGGTWRALAKLHMSRRAYPLHVVQGYVMPADPGLFAELVEGPDRESSAATPAVSSARRPLLGYGAVILEEVIRSGQPSEVVVSTLGVREGMLFERLDRTQRNLDPLMLAARALNADRARSPQHGEDLCLWTDGLFAALDLTETADQRRLRHAACLLSDTAWRAHPDYRGLQAFTTLANAAFVGIDHPGRCFVAIAIQCRHDGLDAEIPDALRALIAPAMLERARIVAAAMRIAFQMSAAMGGVLPSVPLGGTRKTLTLKVPERFAALAGNRVQNRLKQFAKLVGREPEIVIDG